jgi:phage terminase large subunit-like protein
LEVGRKFGKSALCAVLGLYCLIAESDGQVEIDVAAMTRKQAAILFKKACGFAKNMDKK